MSTRFLSRTIAVSAILCVLATPSALEAAYTSAVVGSTATMIGDASGDALAISQAGGLFRHNRFTAGDPGFNSDFDFDSTVPGDQTLAAASGIININAGDGNDLITLDNGIDLRGAVDGGPGNDTIDYAPYSTDIRVNLGLGTTGLSASLAADQENPPTTHPGTGTAVVSNYNVVTRTFDINVTVSDLPPLDVTGFHIHRAPVGVNGPIIVDFTGVAPLVPAGTGFTFSATGLTLPSNSEAAFLGGGTYVNIHTATFPGGAIRGQLFSSGNANLGSGIATGTTGIAGIENAIAGTSVIANSLVGDSSVNTINGGGGVDWIVGGPGNDTLNGGAGADVLVWSNGDGTDVDEGGPDSDTVQVNGSTAAGDVFQISPGPGGRIDFDRTNLGVFSLDIGTVETLTVNGIGGDDSITANVLAGVASLTTLNLNGFAGNDTISSLDNTGAFTITVNGGTGSDTLRGPDVAATWNVTAPNLGNITGLVTAFRFIETLNGGGFSDTFNVKAFATGTPTTVLGGAAADTLNYDAEFRPVSGDLTPPDGTITSPGVQSVSFGELQTVNILNAQPTNIAINDVTVGEGSTAIFNVTLSSASPATVTVNFATADGSAVAPGDYMSQTGMLTFAPGVTLQTISVPVIADGLPETSETFFINLSGAVNATIVDAQGQGTIASPVYTSTVVGSTATMIGDSGDSALAIAQSGGLFVHNRFAAGDFGFNSMFDFDTTVAGDQTVSASAGIININAGDGNDAITLDDGIDLRGVIDGGLATDTIDYSPYTTAVRVNLGQGTTGLNATLGADQENPPTTHAGTGTATVSNYSVATRTFDINVAVSDLPPGDVTGFHIHQAPVGVNGPIIVDFTGLGPLVPAGTGFTFTATGLTLPAASEAAFLGGATYVNIHTAAFPGGAIRGQLFSGGNQNQAPAATGTTGVFSIEVVTGGPGGDSLVGNNIVNTLNGGGGADWIVGGPGNDTLNGGAGADVLVWSNGDGTDVDEGGPDSDTVQVNGSTTAGDVFAIAANGTRINFARTNLGTFSLDIGTVETLTVNGIGGNDNITVNNLTGVASLTTLNMNGFDGPDTFFLATPSAAFALNINGHTGNDGILGPDATTTWNVTAPNLGNITGLVTAFRFVENIAGASGNDTFNVRAFATGTPAVTGGAGADTLNYDAEMRPVSGDTTPPDGSIDSPGVQSVIFTQIETVNVVNAQTPPPPPPPPPGPPAPPANQPPTISGLSSTTIEENASATFTLMVGDDATPATSLVVTASSSNAALVPASGLMLTGSGATRTLTVTPLLEAIGQTTLTVTVSDGTLATTVTAVLTVVAVTAPPLEPTALTATVLGGDILLSWTAPATGRRPSFYVLEGGTAPGTSTLPVVNTRSAQTSFALTLPPGTYFFRARSGNRAGTSAVSNEVSVVVTTAAANVPGPPTGVFVSVNGTRVTLSWQPPITGGAATEWIIELDTTPGPGDVRRFSVPASVLSVTGDLPRGEYVVRVRGLNAAGVGPASNEPRFSVDQPSGGGCDVPDAPVLLPPTIVGQTVTLGWRPPRTGGPASYLLLVGSVPGGSDLGILNVGPVTAFVAQASPGTYHITVVATNTCGPGTASNSVPVVVTGVAPLGPPSNVRFQVVGNSVTIAWDAVPGALSYLIEAGTAPGASNAAVQSLAATTITVPRVPSGVYYVRVRAIGAGGTSAPSAEVIIVVP